MAFVEFERVSFRYPVYDHTSRSLKVSFLKEMVGAAISSKNKSYVEIEALRNVSFSLKDGDRIGLLGRNGSGKSTTLRLTSKVAHPTVGKVRTEGRIVSIIERGLGLNPDLSGRANIELPLRLLGATNAEVKLAQEEIPEWTGLGRFIDLPVRTYSEGMNARLLFAICTALESDILVLDEWLGVGDAEFTAKAQERISGTLARTSIVVLASHSPETIMNTCNLCGWMDRGRLLEVGEPEAIIAKYLAAVDEQPHG